MRQLHEPTKAKEGIVVARYDPKFKGSHDWFKAAVAAEICRFDDEEAMRTGRPFDVSRFGYATLAEGLLVNIGGNYIWKRIRESSAASGGNSDTTVLFNNANTKLGVGDSSTAAAVGQTDLQAATNKLRKAMDTSYPAIQGEQSATDRQFIVRSTYASSDANYSWQEFAIFNAASGDTMLDRFVSNQGTKVSGQVWQLTVTITAS
jgi:hypothetical protein